MLALMFALSIWVAPPMPAEDQALAGYCAQTFHEQVRVAVSIGAYGDCITANPVGAQDALVVRRGNTWRILVRGGGWIDQMSMAYHRVPATIAQALFVKKDSVYREKFGSR